MRSQTISGASANQNGTVSYVLDAVGNRLQRNSTIAALPSTVNAFNNKDQLDTGGYDPNGNTIAADGKTFTYTYENRLKTMNGNAVTLAYDGNGNRTTKTAGGVTTNYLVDELSPSGYAQVVEEQVSGQVRKAYVWGHMLISQRQLVAGNYVTHYYGQDGSENVRQLFDNTGAVTDTFDYDAFGILIGRTGTTANSYLYRSQQFDADLGFYYNRARYYDQSRGRFLSRDTFDGAIQEPRSLHKYLYANVNPVTFSDPSGFQTAPDYARLFDLLLKGTLALLTLQMALHFAILNRISIPFDDLWDRFKPKKEPKVWNVKAYLRADFDDLHSFIQVKHLEKNDEWIYEVGFTDRREYARSRANPDSYVNAKLFKDRPDNYTWKSLNLGVSVVTLTDTEFSLWETSIFGGPGDVSQPREIDFRYKRNLGPNCFTWATKASALAWLYGNIIS